MKQPAPSKSTQKPNQRWGNNSRQEDQSSGKDAILNAAVACIEEQGVAKTTIDDIANLAKISRRTVYRYYPNKQAILQAIIDEQADIVMQKMNRVMEKQNFNFTELLTESILFIVEHGPQSPGHELLLGQDNVASTSHLYMNSEAMGQRWASTLKQPFIEAQQSGEVRQDIRYKDLMTWVGRLVYSFIQFPAPKEQIKKDIGSFLIQGLI